MTPDLRQQGGGKSGNKTLVVRQPAVPQQVRPGGTGCCLLEELFKFFSKKNAQHHCGEKVNWEN